MKFAQKMVLIPEAEYITLLHKGKIKPTKIKGKKQAESMANRIKQNMKDVLKGKRDHEAATKMSQLVGAYLRHKASEKPTPSKPKKEDLLDFFEPIYHKKVDTLISKLHDQGIEWNDKKESKLPSGDIVPHSNIVDLIKEAVVAFKKKSQRETVPVGWKAFITAIASSSIPKSLFTKRSTLHDIDTVQHEWEVY